MKRTRRRTCTPHVALIVETSMAYGREILHGVARFARESGPWTFYLEQRSLLDPMPPWLENWEGDGIISGVCSEEPQFLKEIGIPTVDLNDQRTDRCRPHIQSDHEAIGALAAAHLLERGFQRFAFFGYPGFEWSNRCFDGFSKVISDAGFSCQQYCQAQRVSWGHQLPSWEAEMDGVSRWIASLPRPLGLMACNDFRGFQALDACHRAGVAVPEEVAVIGVDNEVLACELAYPPLSSVIPDCRTIGYEAAKLLDRMMKGEPAPETTHQVAPTGISIRQSTDVTAIEDQCLAEALRYIRENACEGIGVDDVLEHVSVSRSVMQRRFRAGLGRTIHETITGERLRRVEQFLVETELPYETIATRAGFSSAGYLSTVFRQATGVTLAAYRRQHSRRLY